MSTRSQVLIRQHNQEDVYLYKHCDGPDLPKLVANWLKTNNPIRNLPCDIIGDSLLRYIIKNDIDFENNEMSIAELLDQVGGKFDIGNEIHGDIQVLVVIDVERCEISIITDYTGDGKHYWLFISYESFIDFMNDIETIDEKNNDSEIF